LNDFFYFLFFGPRSSYNIIAPDDDIIGGSYNDKYKDKYLKYKNKYLELKKEIKKRN
jgi:hypothetical protein